MTILLAAIAIFLIATQGSSTGWAALLLAIGVAMFTRRDKTALLLVFALLCIALIWPPLFRQFGIFTLDPQKKISKGSFARRTFSFPTVFTHASQLNGEVK